MIGIIQEATTVTDLIHKTRAERICELFIKHLRKLLHLFIASNYVRMVIQTIYTHTVLLVIHE